MSISFKEKQKREKHLNDVKSFFDIFDNLKKLVMHYHSYDKDQFMKWLFKTQIIIGNVKPITLIRQGKIILLHQTYIELVQKHNKSKIT